MVDVVVGQAERALEEQRLEHRRVEPAVGLGEAVERAVGDRLVLEREAERLLEVGVDVAHGQRPVAVGRRQLVECSIGVTSKCSRSASRERLLASCDVVSRIEAVGGEDGQARVLERDEVHQHVAVLALAADLVGVDARGLVAVVAVGDQQLGVLRASSWTGAIAPGSATRQSRLRVPSSSVASPNGACPVAGSSAPQAAPSRVGVEGEDRRQVRLRRARQAQAVLARARVRALVRADPAGAVVLDAHAREEAAARVRRAVRAGVVLDERPERRLVVADDGALGLPLRQQRRRRARTGRRPRPASGRSIATTL